MYECDSIAGVFHFPSRRVITLQIVFALSTGGGWKCFGLFMQAFYNLVRAIAVQACVANDGDRLAYVTV